MTSAAMKEGFPQSMQAGLAARLAIRRGQHSGSTSAVAPGLVQANLAILPQSDAEDFLRFCERNPKPCPLLAVSAPGDWRLPALAEDLDLRAALPRLARRRTCG